MNNDVKFHNVKVTRLDRVKTEEPKKEITKVINTIIKKEEPKKEIINNIKTVQVVNLKSFYDQYMKENKETPDKMIRGMNSAILTTWFYMKSVFIKDDIKIQKMIDTLTTIDYNKYIDIFVKTTKKQLEVMCVRKLMNDNIYKLYEVLHFLIIEKGANIKCKYDLSNLLRECRFMASEYKKYKVKELRRMFLIKDGQIIHTADNIECDDSLEGCMIMLEHYNNRFINIPYVSYKKLSAIDRLSFRICVYDIAYAGDDEDYPQGFPIANLELSAGKLSEIVDIMFDYENLTMGLSMLSKDGADHLYDILDSEINVYYKNGRKTKFQFNEFWDKYLSFLEA